LLSVCGLVAPSTQRALQPDAHGASLLSATVAQVESFRVISLEEDGFNETKTRLIEAGVPDDRVLKWPGIDGEKQKTDQKPLVRNSARSLGVLQPDEDCSAPPKLKIDQPKLRRFTEFDLEVCNENASLDWHQFGISAAHAKAWEDAARRESDSWTVILEQDAHFVPVVNSTWYDLTKQILAQAPADADFIWLSGQTDSLRPKAAADNYTADGPLLLEGATTFCPHTYAINARGAHKLVDAARKRHIYHAVDIFLIDTLYDFAKPYAVNDRRLVRDGLIRPAPTESCPRTLGIGYQGGWRHDSDASSIPEICK